MTWRTCRASGMCFSLFVISRVSYFQSEDVPRCPKMPLPRCPKIELNDWLEVSNCDVPSLGWDWLDQLINMCQEIESANSWKRRSEVAKFAFWDTKVKHAAAAVMSCHVSGALWGRVCLKMVACPQYSNFHGQIDTWHLIKLSDLGAPYFQTKLFNTIHAGFMNGAAEDVHWMTTFWSLCQAAAWDFQRDPLQEWYGSVHWPRGMMVADLESIHRSVPLKKVPTWNMCFIAFCDVFLRVPNSGKKW